MTAATTIQRGFFITTAVLVLTHLLWLAESRYGFISFSHTARPISHFLKSNFTNLSPPKESQSPSDSSVAGEFAPTLLPPPPLPPPLGNISEKVSDEGRTQAKLSSNSDPLPTNGQGTPHDDARYAHCSDRDEWRRCNVSEDAALRRFLLVGPYDSPAGTGHAMAMVGHLVRLSIKYRLRLVFRPPLLDRDNTDLGSFFGLVGHSDLLREEDPVVRGADLEVLPLSNIEDRLKILDAQVNRTNVKYDPQLEFSHIQFADGHWVDKVAGVTGPVECIEPRFVLREWFRRARQVHRCEPFLRAPTGSFLGKWVLAVHIRRGDIVIDAEDRWKLRNVPHAWYVLAVGMVLTAISKLEAGGKVAVIIFCEGVNNMIIDERGKPVVWDLESSPECTQLGLECLQINVIQSKSEDALGCLIAADVFIGSKSGFSHVAGVLSSNVKFVPSMWHKYAPQDSVVVHFKNRTDAETHNTKQETVDAALKTWKECGSYAMEKRNPYVHGYRIQPLS